MKRRKPHKPVGSPLKAVAARETEHINHLLKLANVPYRLTLEAVQDLFNGCQWKCQDTGRLYSVDNPLTVAWIDDIRHYGIADNLRIVCESESAYYLSWDIEHPRTWAANRAA